MQPMGRLPVTFHLQGRQHKEDVHIYPDVQGVIMSWKAAKSLSILPSHYPQPMPIRTIPVTHTSEVKMINATTSSSEERTVVSKYPTVFDGQIRTVQGEEFRICLAANAKPFCVHTP